MLSSQHKEFLISLQADPRWKAVLDYLHRTSPVYRPSENTEYQVHKMIYESGQKVENDRILSILTLKELDDE